MKILVINCGSSSLKYRLIEADTETVIVKGQFERIGIDGGHFTYKQKNGGSLERNAYIPDHEEAVRLLVRVLTDPDMGDLESLDEIDAIGHRIVHGGNKFTDAVLLTPEVLKEIEACSNLAPNHNPVNLLGVRACMKYMPETKMVGVFDTAFHSTLPEEAYLYGIPYEYYKNEQIRRYGFHGMSHQYVAEETARMLGTDPSGLKVITCHLGNGASITAVKNGKSVDTSMGYTPLEGIIMGTRSGSIDPEIINVISENDHKTLSQVMDILHTKSGIYGLSDYLSPDMRDLTDAYHKGNPNAIRAIKAYVYQIVKYIGAYTTAMDGTDAITFTAGVGENSCLVRSLICQRLRFFGVQLDEAVNENGNEERIISTPESRVKVLVIPTNEELSICRQTKALIRG